MRSKTLVNVLPYIAKENCFALKGGTAINLFIRNLPRLSVDIDLAYLGFEDREKAFKNINEALQKQIDMQQGELEFTKPSSLLTTEEAAEYLKLKPNTFERWRSQYPHRLPFVKIGRTVKYRKEDLNAFVSENRQGS